MSLQCTIPSEVASYVSSPNARGTLDILWSSLATIVLCTWTVLKLPIRLKPPEMGKWHWKICSFVIKSTKMLSTILAPELRVGTAFEEYLSVKSSIAIMKNKAKEDGVEWSRTHSYFANMGGIVVYSVIQKAPDSQNIGEVSRVIGIEQPPESQNIGEVSRVIGIEQPPESQKIDDQVDELFEKAKQDIKEKKIPREKERRLIRNVEKLVCSNEWSLNTNQLLVARQLSIISSLPNIPEDILGDLSHLDEVAQALTLLQLIQLYLELIFRALEHLPITLLEIAVLGYSFCAFLAFYLDWNKPKDVNIRFTVYADRNFKDAKELRQLGFNGPLLHEGFRRILPYDFPEPINNFDAKKKIKNFDAYLFGAASTGAVFGLIHVSAWNFAFPTDREKTLWRAASIISAVVPNILTVLPLLNFWYSKLDLPPPDWIEKIQELDPKHIFEFIFFFIYVVARGYIIFEVFRALFFLPPKAFSVTWTVNLPQIG